MNTGSIKNTAVKLFVEDSPWQFRLLAIMVFAFFGGGLLLDTWASQIPFPDSTKISEEIDKMAVEFTKSKHESLTGSAALLYDFAKIALGALIATVTQSIKQITKSPEDENA